MKKIIAVLLVLVLALGLAACGGGGEDAPEVTRLTMVTGGDSGTYYAFGGVIASVLSSKIENLEITAVTSGASAANCRSLNNGEADLAIMQNDVLGYAVTGTETMEADGAMPKLKAIASMYPEAVQLVALANSGITSVEDLAGKKVCVGDQGSGSETNAKQVLEAYGLSYEDFDVQYLSFSEASTAMQNGTVDAAFATSALPNNAIVELSTMKDIVVIPIDGAGADALIASYPFYAPTIISDDIYNVPGAGTVAMLATLVCTEDMSEDLVYSITKTLFEAKEDLIAGHSRGNDIELEKAKDGVTVDFHPGALKYYEEMGI
ncbi:MAG: TAXI family TRAP transporter solute-binding subunit [Bacillota bacterium]|jgi:TRAP transporter TAXI family solute receptor|nr:TAXI family TRAP transporter solute-binding subunit [Eubacteriales bacterium]MDI9492118.1 TAXI family TRAP transporter solute-binding subunit [Bacillota bacterium]NLV70792.1 TAXI family TRAP transporter solute-binding subunit [Clostridiales bacterium]HRV33028.1 TAXI family TRAP transporter solute-binding subunit [Anaerovoracaceae bacterium]MDD3537813.1 TAXI family TRAP transporter solute-binding subunit [Eubacteriales bacterium]